MEYRYDIGGTERIVDVETAGDVMKATLDGKTYKIDAMPSGDGQLVLRIDGRIYPVRYARDERGLHVVVKGISILAVEPGESGNSGTAAFIELVDGKQILVAPMPGQVVKVNVSVGDKVGNKQCLVIVEAMKMENELTAAIDGTVTAIHVEAGQQVDALQPLVEVTQTDESE